MQTNPPLEQRNPSLEQRRARRDCNECEGRRSVVPLPRAKPVTVDIFWQNERRAALVQEGWRWSSPDISEAPIDNACYVTSAEALNYAKLALARYFCRSAEAARKAQARSAEAALRDQALRERDYYIGAHSYGEDCKGFFVVRKLQGQGWRWADACDGSWNGPFGSSRAAYMAARASARAHAPTMFLHEREGDKCDSGQKRE